MRQRLFCLFIFALAFALVEAAVVLYLRRIFGFDQNYPLTAAGRPLINFGLIAFLPPQALILPDAGLTAVEKGREAATLVMLIAVALITGTSQRQKLGAFLIAFGVWDLGYYLFLKLLTGWPAGLLTPDVFFLDPLPWVGPVLTALAGSFVLLILGLILFLKDQTPGPSQKTFA